MIKLNTILTQISSTNTYTPRMNKIKYQSAIECVRPTGLATMPGIEMSHFMMGITKLAEEPLFIEGASISLQEKIKYYRRLKEFLRCTVRKG